MILEKIGTILNKNTKPKIWWIKLAVAIVISNVFFFLLFSSDSPQQTLTPGLPIGQVEIQLEAQLLTPFQKGKKILIVTRSGRKKIEGMLQGTEMDNLGKITVSVREDDAITLFQHREWEILPYLKNLKFASVQRESGHEIRY